MTGSPQSVLEYCEPHHQFKERLFEAYHQSQKLKIFCTCYGHQLIAKQFGGQVVRKNRFGEVAETKFDPNVKKQFPFLSALPDVALAVEHHADFVEKAPKGFYVLGSSQTCNVESLISKNGRILSFQLHPQFLAQYTVSYGKRQTYTGVQLMIEENLVVDEEHIDFHHSSIEKIRTCMMEFINS